MKNKKVAKAIRIILAVVGIVAALSLGIMTGRSCANTTDVPAPAVSGSEVADEIIRKEDEKKAAAVELSLATAPTHENVVVPPSPEATKPPEPKLSDETLYIEPQINIEQANFSREVTLADSYGKQWRVWMKSTIIFHKYVYQNSDVAQDIELLVILRPAEKEDVNNYILLDFSMRAPKDREDRWSAKVKRFDSRTQGASGFSIAYDIFREDWQKAEILRLAGQVLNAVFTPPP